MTIDSGSIDIQKILQEFSEKLPKFPDGRIDYTNSDKALVLTCFVKYNNEILLLQRSEKVGTYQKMWNAVAGYVDKIISIEEKALIELQEELSISKQNIESIKIGKPYEFYDREINKTWIVVPCLAELKEKPEIKIDWEHLKYKWINPSEIKEFPVVPDLENSWKNVQL